MERQATETLRRHGLFSVPIDPVKLANALGVEVRNGKFHGDAYASMISRRGEHLLILVDRDNPPWRKRFSIAHELGHYVLHMAGETSEYAATVADLFREAEPRDVPFDRKRGEDIEANRFAAALLMPEALIRDELEKGTGLDVLYRVFNVSEQAMGYRLDNLGI